MRQFEVLTQPHDSYTVRATSRKRSQFLILKPTSQAGGLKFSLDVIARGIYRARKHHKYRSSWSHLKCPIHWISWTLRFAIFTPRTGNRKRALPLRRQLQGVQRVRQDTTWCFAIKAIFPKLKLWDFALPGMSCRVLLTAFYIWMTLNESLQIPT